MEKNGEFRLGSLLDKVPQEEVLDAFPECDADAYWWIRDFP